ncbi:hypothetical protein K439DRAFT_524686 [Ramaria rubella]|nr:hypothetical protein K439DRAFT_524686 [Ramaria rubella]
MSNVTSWSTGRAVSSTHTRFEQTFEQSEYFHKSTGKGGWFCGACAPSRHRHLYFLNARKAMRHEKTQAHRDAVARITSWEPLPADNSWGEVPEPDNNWGEVLEPDNNWGEVPEPDNNWGEVLEPDMREDNLKTRVKRWIRDVAKAEGIEIEEEDEEEEASWDSWDSGRHEWDVAQTPHWGSPVSDPQVMADFKFVEKVAKARGSTKDHRRLHAFYKLPTEEKINKIHEIVHFISCH